MNAAEQYATCVAGLKERLTQMGSPDVVLGLSGGLDSALVACMCADAFGPKRVHAYMLPGPYSSEHSLADAQALALNLGVRAERISIVEPFESFVKELALHCDGFVNTLAAENTQARCRMVVLMALANTHGWAMINAGNKSEAMMGYSTLYGDTAGVYAPIGGLYKTDVFAVAHWLNANAAQHGQVPPIPEHILTKPPSAELAPGQTDEASFGTSYAELDKLLIDHVEHGLDEAELIAAGHEAHEVQRITRRVASYAFKRALEPDFPVIPY